MRRDHKPTPGARVPLDETGVSDGTNRRRATRRRAFDSSYRPHHTRTDPLRARGRRHVLLTRLVSPRKLSDGARRTRSIREELENERPRHSTGINSSVHGHSTGTSTRRARAFVGHGHSMGTSTRWAQALDGHEHSTGTGTRRARAFDGHGHFIISPVLKLRNLES